MAFVASATFAAVLAKPMVAHSAWMRRQASACSSAAGSSVNYASSGAWNSSTTAYAFLTCAIEDNSELPKASLTTLNIHGADNSTTANASAQTCVTYYGVAGGACGGTIYASTAVSWTGNYTLSLPRTFWDADHAADFGVIAITLPPGSSSVRGYFAAN
jgi:hypothetical protein